MEPTEQATGTLPPPPPGELHPHRDKRAHQRQRLWDMAVLFAVPAGCMLLSNGLEFGQGLSVFFCVMLLAYGAMFYSFPDLSQEPDSSRRRRHQTQEGPARVADAAAGVSCSGKVADKTPWIDCGLILLLPATVVVWLLYLVWTHTVLGKLGLAAATVAIPLAVVVLSWFVIRHEGHLVEKTGRPAPGILIGGLLAFWIAAVFVFVVCLVSWIERFGLRS
jgi:hypothetical protein